jgi:hypothetical protein
MPVSAKQEPLVQQQWQQQGVRMPPAISAPRLPQATCFDRLHACWRSLHVSCTHRCTVQLCREKGSDMLLGGVSLEYDPTAGPTKFMVGCEQGERNAIAGS